jgi:large subunit ribosomal protein L2
MGLKIFKPVTAGRRQLVLVDKSELWKGDPEKSLTVGLRKKGGRNNLGRITTRHQGGGHKRRYRMIDFKRRTAGVATVERLEYDPNRTCFIALIRYEDSSLSYILAPQRVKAGDKIEAGVGADIKPGNAMPLRNIPVGTLVHNVELKIGKGGQIARAAGAFVQLIGRDGDYAQLKMRSGELRVVHADCYATIGSVSNQDHKNESSGKAGRSRWLGIRPTVRGIAMNPVDHPHGGRTNGGMNWCTPWGISTKGKRTRKNKLTQKFIIRRRKK